MALSAADGEAFARCVRAGGLVLFPADTVYGLACAPDDAAAVERLYATKGRDRGKPSALMAFDVEAALALAGDGPGERVRRAVRRLLPGPVGVLVPGPDGATVGLRVPDLPWAAGHDLVVLQSSANPAGGADAARLQDVPATIRDACDLVLDAGEALPGVPSTLVDLTSFEADGSWRVVREGALPTPDVAAALSAAR